jgi:dienelactone hydrolase
MGARTALWVAGDEQVTGVVALAPWCEAGDPVAQLAGRDVLIAHGARDRITSPAASLAYARRAVEAGARVRRVEVEGETHAMLRRPRVWDRLVTDFVRLPRAVPDQSTAPAAPNPSGEPLRAADAHLRDPLREVV